MIIFFLHNSLPFLVYIAQNNYKELFNRLSIILKWNNSVIFLFDSSAMFSANKEKETWRYKYHILVMKKAFISFDRDNFLILWFIHRNTYFCLQSTLHYRGIFYLKMYIAAIANNRISTELLLLYKAHSLYGTVCLTKAYSCLLPLISALFMIRYLEFHEKGSLGYLCALGIDR